MKDGHREAHPMRKCSDREKRMREGGRLREEGDRRKRIIGDREEERDG